MICIPFLHPCHCGTNSNKPESPCGDRLQGGENLRRRISSGVYYGFAKLHGKQKSVSRKTTDKATASPKISSIVNPACNPNSTQRWKAAKLQ
jgi:hypothetical protein